MDSYALCPARPGSRQVARVPIGDASGERVVQVREDHPLRGGEVPIVGEVELSRQLHRDEAQTEGPDDPVPDAAPEPLDGDVGRRPAYPHVAVVQGLYQQFARIGLRAELPKGRSGLKGGVA